MNAVTKSAATTSLNTVGPVHAAIASGVADVGQAPLAAETGQEKQADIFVAAQFGDWHRIEQLIRQGKATARDKNEQGITALHWAAINDRLLACKTLLDHGAEVNASGGDLSATPMMWAAKNGHVYIVHLLVTHGGDPAMTDSQGYNVLQLATHSSNVLLIIYLLHIDMAVDSVDPDGHTCLMWAAYQGDTLSVDTYLKWGADVNLKDKDGLNAVHWAVVRGNRLAIKRIVEEGGDLCTPQNEGKTPRQLAKELKTLNAFETALELADRDADSGLANKHWISSTFSMRCIFSLPHLYFGPVLKLFAVAPIMISLPVNAILLYGSHHTATSILTPNSLRSLGIHRTPYLAGIFSASAFWTALHWIFRILPNLMRTFPLLNALFCLTFSYCLYNFFRAMTSDPGFIPKNGGRSEQREAIEDLLRAGEYDSQRFCTDCLLRRPLRSKHCKICGRCVAKHDHHCPWVGNCVGIGNHRMFVLYVISLFLGIPMYVYLVFLHLNVLGPVEAPLECTLLAESPCRWLQIDAFGILLAAWDSIQMTWITMLLVVQLWQIARATTTQEVVNIRRHGYMGGGRQLPVQARLLSAVTSGSTDPEVAGLTTGQGPDPVCEHHHHHHRHDASGSSCMSRVTRLLGIDQFLNTARAAGSLSSTSERSLRGGRFVNVFDGGPLSNCTDFWSTVPQDGVDGHHGWGFVRRRPVDYYRLYTLPDTPEEMYSSVPTTEELGEEVV